MLASDVATRLYGNFDSAVPISWESVERAGELDAPFAVSYESHIPIYVLRSSHNPLAKLWPSLKHYE